MAVSEDQDGKDDRLPAENVTCAIVIGPSGNGKSTLAWALAQELGWDFVEGDAHHPPANILKMKRGEPLTDKDRIPFLHSVGRHLANAPGGIAASCSALRRSYRDRLRAYVPDALFISPDVPRKELARRVFGREGHFMPPELLDSQISTFETLGSDERGVEVDGCIPVSEQVQQVLRFLRR